MDIKFKAEPEPSALERVRWFLGTLNEESSTGWYGVGIADLGAQSREELEKRIAGGLYDDRLCLSRTGPVALVAAYERFELFPQVGELDPKQLSREAAIAEVIRLREKLKNLEALS